MPEKQLELSKRSAFFSDPFFADLKDSMGAGLERRLAEFSARSMGVAGAGLGEAACLVDDAGRARILDICKKIRQTCARLDQGGKKHKLQLELQKTATGRQEWQKTGPSGDLANLLQPRGRVPLSYWDWRIWTMARPTLWRFGDAADLYPDRETPLTVGEWMSCMLLREEMEYSMPTDTHPFKVNDGESGP